MKKLCLFLFALFIVYSTFSQSEKGYVFLKNGTILKGKYSYFNDSKKIRVESAGNTWVFDAAEIDSISNGRVKKVKELKSEIPETFFFYRTEMGALIGNSENNQSAPFSLTSSVNYTFRPKMSAGIGTGVEFFNESYLPVFLNLEYKFRNSWSTPYIFVKGGYEIALEESGSIYYDVYPVWSSVWPGPYYNQGKMKAQGGIMVNPGFGYMHMFSSGFGLSCAFGYQFHRLHYKGENDYALDIDYNRLSVKIGILFR